MNHWRLVDSGAPPRRGADNMAIDRALVEGVEAGGPPTLRLYYWDPPCLSLGRNQLAAGIYDEAAAAARGIDIVRRPTGGRAVLHDREVTYSVVVPVGVLGSPRATYAAINRALVAGLRRLGVVGELQGEGEGEGEGTGAEATALGPNPCFDGAAPGEVVAEGRKLIGSAQRREGSVLLQHGSLLLDGDQSAVVDLLRPHAGDHAGAAALGPGAGLALAGALAPVAPPGAGARVVSAGVRPSGERGPDAPAAPPFPALAPPPFPALAPPPPATLRQLLGHVPERARLEDALVAGFVEALGIGLAPDALSSAEREAARRWRELFGSAAWTWRR